MLTVTTYLHCAACGEELRVEIPVDVAYCAEHAFHLQGTSPMIEEVRAWSQSHLAPKLAFV